MTRQAAAHAQAPAWTLAVAATLSVQVGSALSIHLISAVGAAGTAWLRLSIGAVIFVAVTRPPLRLIRRRDMSALAGLGITAGLQTIAFLSAIERIPLGTAVAIEFLGPLTVAAIHSHSGRALIWPAIALAGVTVLTEPWHGDINTAGVTFAGLAAIGWASYILLTQHIGDRFTGTSGLSLTVPVAAATSAIAGIPQAAGHITPGVLLAAAGLAILLPVLPYAFEMLALRHMTKTAFGTLMALEPAIGVLTGLAVLHQQPSITQLTGIVLVIIAGSAAQRNSRRHPGKDQDGRHPRRRRPLRSSAQPSRPASGTYNHAVHQVNSDADQPNPPTRQSQNCSSRTHCGTDWRPPGWPAASCLDAAIGSAPVSDPAQAGSDVMAAMVRAGHQGLR